MHLPKTTHTTAAEGIDESMLLTIKSADASAKINIQEFCSVGFSHHLEIIKYATTTDERMFYIHLTAVKHWNVLWLRDMLRADIYHHQGTLPNNFLKAMPNKNDALFAVSMFRDEYFLDFINIDDIDAEDAEDVDERVVEKSLVAIELKRGEFKPSYLGQLNFYLNVLDDKERREGEKPAIGLILCKDMDRSVVELAIRSYSNPMGVATYRLPGDVPEEYKVMRPIMEHAQQLLEGN